MKRTVIILSLIFALAIALSASIPTLAASSTTTTVSGTLGAQVEIQAITGVSLPPLVAGGTVSTDPSAPMTVSVKANKLGWTLAVKDNVGSGFMDTPTTDPLDNELQIKVGTGGTPTDITGSNITLVASGAKGNTVDTVVYFSQLTTWDDDPSVTDYTIQLLFTATAP